jgi:hypothetical protein
LDLAENATGFVYCLYGDYDVASVRTQIKRLSLFGTERDCGTAKIMRYDLYGGMSGLVLLDRNLSEDEVRGRLEEYFKQPTEGYEFRVEAIAEAKAKSP